MNLQLTSPVTARASIKLLNEHGRLVLGSHPQLVNGNNRISIAIPDNTQPGYYILVTQVGDKTRTEKVLIVK